MTKKNSVPNNFQWHRYPSVHDVIANTKFKTYEMACAAIQTLAWLEDGAPHKFDGLPGVFRFNMTVFRDEDYGYNGCGTSCCMAGAMVSYMDHKKVLKTKYGEKADADEVWIDNVFDFYEGDGSELDKLFFPKDRNHNLVNKTPFVAARTLRNYMMTGKVNYRAPRVRY